MHETYRRHAGRTARGTSALITKEHARKITRFDEIFDIVDDFPKKCVAVAVPHHSAVLESVKEADARDLADAILVGDEALIRQAADEAEYELDPARIIHVPKTAVPITIAKVGKRPINPPTWINNPISIRGIARNATNSHISTSCHSFDLWWT